MKKRRSFFWLQLHSIIHLITSIFVVGIENLNKLWILTPIFNLTGWHCVFIICFAHMIEDLWRINSVRRKPSYDTTLYFLFDQFIHLIVIFVFSGYTSSVDDLISGFVFNYPAIIVESNWLTTALICLVLATSFTAILIYFIEHDVYGRLFLPTKAKYFGILERFLIVLFLILPGGLWLLVFFSIFINLFIRYKNKNFDVSWLYVVVGYPAAIIAGVYLRFFSKIPWLV